MFRDALNEIRLHPGRIVATLIAIAISVGFMAGAVTFIATVRDSTAKAQSIQISRADLVVTGEFTAEKAILDATRSQTGVASAEYARTTTMPVTKGNNTAFVEFRNVPGDAFAWASLTEGRWPKRPDEIVLTPKAMNDLQAAVGDQVGLTEQMPKATVVGVSNDPALSMTLIRGGYGSDAIFEGSGPSRLMVALRDDADPAAVKTRLADALAPLGVAIQVTTGEDARQAVINDMTSQFDVMKYMLLGFAVISLLVGMIIIANTFNILLAQRRQQIGLLRAVGASGSQVRGRFLSEAALLGALGSGLGLLLGFAAAAIGTWATSSLHWGLTLPAGDLALAFGAGVVATIVSAVAPSLKATQVSPMEALQIVPTKQTIKRITLARYVVCGVSALVGAVLVYVAMTAKEYNIVPAVAAGFAITIAVLGAAPLYVPALIRLLGRVFGFAGPTVRLAAQNASRNPQRTAATATALMLAVGLIVTLQVAVATMRTTAIEGLANRFPVDFAITAFSDKGVRPDVADKVAKVPGVSTVAAIPGGILDESATSGETWRWAWAPGDKVHEVAPGVRQAPPTDAQAYVGFERMPKGYDQKPVTFTGPNGSVSLVLVESRFAGLDSVVVSPANLQKLVGTPTTAALWIDMADDANVVSVMTELNKISTNANGGLSGAAAIRYTIEQVINVTMLVLTALLGVAVIIALVGVANTLGLSVIERGRESALLRALGMQKSGLRLMLLVEALLIAIVGTGVGIAAGAFFGWLGTTSAYKMMQTGQPLVYSIDPLWTGGLLLIAVLAASLASVLPGRRAANATPTEALAAT